ncbi:E3 ubiquitin-protein ligase [Vanrija pseudolonga]|uniref:E3 ubiquitin-protein ligase n=1 Tax=Vanrija pseudolonga TaxID=143232 RepID=A0AAF0Y2J8_9TREE|nr:E3 ubiquitin-protein ligase [Vanrija pseudolonga]
MPPRLNTAQADLDDDDIVVLNEAPVHMRPKARAAPILVLSSDEDEPGPSAPRGSGRGKRTRSSSSPILIEQPAPRKRKTPRVQTGDSAHSSAVNAEAGPSNQPAPGSDPQAPIVPKADYLVDLVVDIIPDICPDWVKTNLTQQIAALAPTSNVPGQDAVRIVIDMAFALDAYPKAGAAAAKAAPQDREAEDSQYTDPNYRKDKRTGLSYRSQALEVLESHFLMIPVGFIRQTFQTGGGFQLIPTYLILLRQQAGGPGLFAPLKKGRTETKGKNHALPDEDEWFNDPIVVRGGPDYHDPSGYVELRREKKQLIALMNKEKETKEAEIAAAKAAQEKEAAAAKAKEDAIKTGNAAECGCCFDMEPLSEMVSCDEGHLFCKTCVKSLAESKLGEQLTAISCMDMSGCANLFTEGVLAQVLPTKTLELYHRLKQYKDLEMAEIDGLESCPFCPYAVVIDNEAEKLFHCLNTTCLKVTCRKCKRPDHIPKRCEEVEADLKLDKRHAVEEAMSEALMRKCPKCSKPYVKEHGCNKIMCHSCNTMSCYICQKAIPEGYAHFDQGRPAAERKSGKCRLWDQNEAQTEAQRRTRGRTNQGWRHGCTFLTEWAVPSRGEPSLCLGRPLSVELCMPVNAHFHLWPIQCHLSNLCDQWNLRPTF